MKKIKLSSLLFGTGALLLLLLFLFPIWSITLTAPQYPDGISMYIWINKITGDSESTLQNVNILNHYIGMKFIEPDSIKELSYFQYVIISMSILGLLIAIINKGWLKVSWIVIMILLGIAGIYDFYVWEYDYGHNLSPLAPIKISGMVYQPPLFGEKMLLNFKSESYPHLGSLFFFLSISLNTLSLIIHKREIKYEK
jgi:copper chaperone NosL